jgi:hypothetical protein
MLLQQGRQVVDALDPDVLLDLGSVGPEDDDRGRRRRQDLVAECRRERS